MSRAEIVKPVLMLTSTDVNRKSVLQSQPLIHFKSNVLRSEDSEQNVLLFKCVKQPCVQSRLVVLNCVSKTPEQGLRIKQMFLD